MEKKGTGTKPWLSERDEKAVPHDARPMDRGTRDRQEWRCDRQTRRRSAVTLWIRQSGEKALESCEHVAP
jgi:hypothetical protein